GRQASKVSCVDVAALFGAAVLRRNPGSVIVPFNHAPMNFDVQPEQSILPVARNLAALLSGGTDCSAPLTMANYEWADRKFAGVVLISDNESWIGEGRWGTTRVMEEWLRFSANQAALGGPMAKLVCIDLQPYTSVQAPDRYDILNV